MKLPFDRISRSTDSNHKPLSKRSRLRRAVAKSRANLLHERLEGRAMMAIFAVPQTTGGTVIAIDGNAALTDLYLRGTLGGGVQVATNSSFNPVTTADSLDWVYQGLNANLHTVGGSGPLYITSATPNSVSFSTVEANGFTNGSTSISTDFALSNGNINSDIANAVIGELRFGGRTWTFTNDGNGRLFFTQTAGAPGGPQPRNGLSTVASGLTSPGLRGGGVRGSITISWDAPVSTFESSCPRIDVSYTYRSFIGLLPPNVPRPPDVSGSDLDIGVSAGSLVRFTIPGIPPKNAFGGMSVVDGGGNPVPVPGTQVTSGTITVHDVLVSGMTGSQREDLTFGFSDASGTMVFTPEQRDWLQIDPDSTLQNLIFVNRYGVAPQNGSVEILPGESDVTPGRVTISGTRRHLEYTIEQRANQVTVWPGFDVGNAMTVELTRSGGSFNVLSPIVNAASLAALGTTNVFFEAPISVTGGLTLAGSGVPGSFLPQVQTARIEAPNAAGSYSFTIVNGSLTIGPSGSLSGALPSLSGVLTTPSGSVNALMQDSDLLVLGTIYASTQFYDLKSPTLQYIRNTRFSTQADVGGPDSGLIRGTTVVVAMANPGATDAPPDALNPDISVHAVSLKTQVDTFRTRAAGRVPDFPAENNFPYDLAIREEDAITIDAVAGSSRPISVVAGGSIIMGSGLSTVSDVTLWSLSAGNLPSLLSVAGPMATTKGKIRLVADGVVIRDSVLVTKADEDEFRDDIWITANAGGVELRGDVSAVNRVKIEQFSGLRLVDRPFSNRTPLTLPDLGTVTQTIDVAESFVFDNLDVEVDIQHSFVGDLVGTLIAPDGRRFTLFNRNGGSGDNFQGTIFDSDAVDAQGNPLPISAGVPPFTGRFRPVGDLSALDGGLSVGQWRLEIQDAAGGDVGTLNNFTLRFRVLGPVPASVFGPALVTADSLLLDVQGAVGDSSLSPTNLGFFLRTNVDTITGTIGGSVAIDELNDVAIPGLRAGGFASLRANGADPTSGPNSGNAALRANLIDITGLDVAAPNGSLDVVFDTSKTVELGNATALRTGRSLNSVAAGDVRIRSSAGSIVALDAPVAGANGRAARVATTVSLAMSSNGQSLSNLAYSPGNPGVTASTLQGRGNLNHWLGVQVQPLRAGDRVLVKNQSDASQNGVYTLSFMSTATWTSNTTWMLMRSADADTSAEFPSNAFVRVGEQQAGNVNQVGTWQITANYVPLFGATQTATLTSSSTTVTVGTTNDLSPGMVVFGPGIAADTTIASIDNGTTISLSRQSTISQAGATLKFVLPAVTRSATTTANSWGDVLLTGLSTTTDLQIGMLVVGAGIPADTVITRILNVSTVVLSNSATTAVTGDVKFIRPFATRTGTTATTAGTTTVSGLSATGDLLVGMVVVGAGIAADTTIASIVNGTAITLSRQATSDQAGATLKFVAASPTNFGRAPISVALKPVTTDIGSNNPNSNVTFVVSTSAGSNSAAGSLGKMLALRQQNVARLGGVADQATGSQPMDFRFSAAVATEATPIRLTQELPEITQAFTIGGSPTYPVSTPIIGKASTPLIDGSRITHTRSGRLVVDGDLVSGFVVSGPAANGTVIRNVNVGGFSRAVGGAQSAAIDVRDATGVLISSVNLGVSETGIRLANGVGVRFTGAGVTSGTLLNSNVFGSNDSGLVVENGASGVSVVGSTFGKANNFNAVGASLRSGVNQFGVDPSTPVRPIPQVQATRVAANQFRFALPADWSPWRLGRGLQILSLGVIPKSGNARPTISAVSITATTVTVTVAGGDVVGVPGSSTSPFLVTFVSPDLAAIPGTLASRVENRFALPTSRAVGITAGMQVSGPNIRLTAGSRAATVTRVGSGGGVTTFEIMGGTIVGDGAITLGSAPATRFSLQVTKVVNAFTLSAASRGVSALLHSGLALTGPMIQVPQSQAPNVPPNRTPASISLIERNVTTGVTTVTIEGGTVTGNGRVSFGHVVYTELNGITITLPNTRALDSLYLGQTVSGGGIAAGTVIARIHRTTGTVTLTFTEDRKMTRTGFSVISFGVGGRNTITQNRSGLTLAGGATTVTNTTISANTFNGIDIQGSGATLGGQTRYHQIGTTPAPMSRSNQIHSNGGWGVFFASAMNDNTATPDARKNLVRIQGNFLGTTSLSIVPSSIANRRRNDGSVGNVGHVVSGRESAFAGLSNQLVPRLIDGVDASNNQHGRYQVSGGGGGGGGVVPNNPTTRRR